MRVIRSRRYSAPIITDVDYADNISLLANTPTQAESRLDSLEQPADGINLHVNADKIGYMCFIQKGVISTLNGGSLKLEDKSTYLGSNISSTENNINMQLAKAWTTVNGLLIIWKSDLSDQIKCNFSQQRSCQFYYMDAPNGCWLTI